MQEQSRKTTRADHGGKMVAWAERSFPVLNAILEGRFGKGQLEGVHIALDLGLDAKTAAFALALSRAGASVSVVATQDTSNPDVVAALYGSEVAVFEETGTKEGLQELFASPPHIILSDGGTIVKDGHTLFPLAMAQLLGATEIATHTLRDLIAMADAGQLLTPVVDLNASPITQLLYNELGTGQSSVMAIVDITNLQLAGRCVVVQGFGPVGRGVAKHAAALGARVTVCERDPIRALMALCEGYKVCALEDILPTSEVVILATGHAGQFTSAHLSLLPDQAMICVSGGGRFELPMEYLETKVASREVRKDVKEYDLPNGRTIKVLSQGNCVNRFSGEGSPAEVADVILALHLLAVEQFINARQGMGAGVHELASSAQDWVARLKLAAENAAISL